MESCLSERVMRLLRITPFRWPLLTVASCLAGKQFRAVILSAVQTRDSLKESHLPGVELVNDMRVLNTAMTRAQSCVVVVGDAAALCCFGKCAGVWRSYTDHCIDSNSVAPPNFTRAFFEKDLQETARFQKPEPGDGIVVSDAILQELKDEYEGKTADCSSDEDRVALDDFDQSATADCREDESGLAELCKRQSEVYTQGQLFRESNNRGYVIPSENPSSRVNIQGRANLGKTFTGDEVIVAKSRVVGIVREDPSARVLVCTLEEEDHSRRNHSQQHFVRRTMVPIAKNAPRISIHISKKKRNFLPLWELIDGVWTLVSAQHLNEDLRQNSVFVVQVISWKENCHLPLGNTIDIIPVGRSLDDGLRILNEEFNMPASSDEEFFLEDEDGWCREDLRDTFTFTVDPKNAKDLDDAISVRELGDRYELGIHIADVVSLVRQGDQLDEMAKRRGSTYFGSLGKNIPMFPQEVINRCSLLSGQVRSVVSLMLEVNKMTHEIVEKPIFQLSRIRSDRQFSYEEAEKLITQRHQQAPRFDSLEDCVAVAYCFSKVQKKRRLRDWVYSQPDGDRVPGKRKAHLMIEELNVLFNRLAAEKLLFWQKTSSRTPLRCQSRPDAAKIDEFRGKACADFIPLSFHVRNKVDVGDRALSCDSFQVVTAVWKEIQSAARAGDVDRMVDLIAADDIHPPLQPVVDEFRRCSSKASTICSRASSTQKFGHYSLNVPTYTHATSPIRRYMDVVLQRLLHAFIRDSQVQYTPMEISALCNQFDKDLRIGKEYEQKATQISYAVTLNKQSTSKLAFVLRVAPNEDSFALSFPFNKDVFAGHLQVMYRDLQLSGQPLFDKVSCCVSLTWKRLLYTFDAAKVSQELERRDRGSCVKVPLKAWKDVVEAVDKEDWEGAKSRVLSISPTESSDVLPQSSSEEQELPAGEWEHEASFGLELRTGDTLHVQLTAENRRGYRVPALQLVHIKPNFDICVDHVHNPIVCFSRSADNPARVQYSDIMEYKRIWTPMCEMESASSAVDAGNSIIIENLKVNLHGRQIEKLAGSFFLPAALIEEWAIESYLSKCFLCIRKRGLTLSQTPMHSAPVDPREFTWVAHGVTTGAREQKGGPCPGSTVEFYVNHLPMENTPDCIFEKNACFTVEIIPKLLPNM